MITKELCKSLCELVLDDRDPEDNEEILVMWEDGCRWGHYRTWLVRRGSQGYSVTMRFHSEDGLQEDYTDVEEIDLSKALCPTCNRHLVQ